ncbi:MAG TPA: dethiobiotin synthase [Dongiaceae bacterium]|nr:dethiobiotin synthase [Dongiaceae bacterium]
MRARSAVKIIVVTGTDTGVGKSVFTALLLHHLRASGCQALALKPFCSGGRGDVNLLQSLQPGELSDAECNPFYFPEPVAPLVAARKHGRKIRLAEVVRHIRKIASRCETLLVEGAGGLLAPLGEGFNLRDLIVRLQAHFYVQVIVVSGNKLGVINHVLLTVQVLKQVGLKRVSVVLTETRPGQKKDLASVTNPKILKEILETDVAKVPFLGRNCEKNGGLKKHLKFFKKTLARILN